MTPIRIIVQSNPRDAGGRLADLIKQSSLVREEPGCLQAEDFRSTKFPENLLHLELWETPAAFDAHWRRALSHKSSALAELLSLQTPHHYGTPDSPRRQGQNGIELYEHRAVDLIDDIWQRLDAGTRSEWVRWPAWSGVRILIQSTRDPNEDPEIRRQYVLDSETEAGCEQFEDFRGLEYPENTVLMEKWATAESYDIHWLNRLLQRQGLGHGAPAPGSPPFRRRFGQPGAEWYPHCYYTLIDGVWQPERPELRMVSVRW